MEDNVTRQAEEIEALCSIYGKQWHTEDESSGAYSICISEQDRNVVLYVTLPPDYPSQSPPTYQVSAPSVNRQDKQELSHRLESIYLDNIGENILYQWVEAVKDFLQEKFNEKSLENHMDGVDLEEINAAISALSQEPTKPKEVPYISHGEIITDRKSIFQGHAATVTSVEQVKLVLSALMENKKIAHATHNIYAYRIQKEGQNTCVVQDCEDDGETAAGGRLLHLLQIMNVMNVLVVVTRWYGGVLLGPDRFRHINNAARQVLQLSGLVTKKK